MGCRLLCSVHSIGATEGAPSGAPLPDLQALTPSWLCRLWQGHMVNHQFDKSFKWEQGFNVYLQRLQHGIQYSESSLMRLQFRLTGRISGGLHVHNGSAGVQQGLQAVQHCGCFAASQQRLSDWV